MTIQRTKKRWVGLMIAIALATTGASTASTVQAGGDGAVHSNTDIDRDDDPMVNAQRDVEAKDDPPYGITADHVIV